MLKTGEKARQSVVDGVNRVASPVVATAGAEGKFALIESQYGFAPHPTKDGATVLDAVFGTNQYEELGAQMLKQAANRTADLVGDGTTTTTILAQAMINRALAIDYTSHVEIKRGMEEAIEEVKWHLQNLKKTVGAKEMVEIATVSANNDAELGELVAEVYTKVGLDSTIDVKLGTSEKTYVNYVEGIKLERGFAMPHFCTDYGKGVAELEDCKILIYNDSIKAVTEVTEVIRECINTKKSLLIIADDVSEAAMASFIQIKRDSTIQICVSISPEFGEKRENVLQDLALAVGASVYNSKFNTQIVLGDAKKVTAFRDKTIILADDEANKEVMGLRINELQAQIKDADKLDKISLKRRISNLKSSIAEIIVGGTTEMEIKEKKDRIDDAVPALKSAIEGGYIAGGGSALYHIAGLLTNDCVLSSGEKKGFEVVRESIKRPLKQILENAGLSVSSCWFDYTFFKDLNSRPIVKTYGVGVNVKTRRVENMFESGIIDSVKVTEMALDNALSVATIALFTDSLILSKNLGE